MHGMRCHKFTDPTSVIIFRLLIHFISGEVIYQIKFSMLLVLCSVMFLHCYLIYQENFLHGVCVLPIVDTRKQ